MGKAYGSSVTAGVRDLTAIETLDALILRGLELLRTLQLNKVST
jgi:hypothetical protein